MRLLTTTILIGFLGACGAPTERGSSHTNSKVLLERKPSLGSILKLLMATKTQVLKLKDEIDPGILTALEDAEVLLNQEITSRGEIEVLPPSTESKITPIGQIDLNY